MTAQSVLLTPVQAQIVLEALADAAEYRAVTAYTVAECWDCSAEPTGICEDHAIDMRIAGEYTRLRRNLLDRGGLV